MDREDFVTLKLYDSLGKEVQTLIQGYLGQGSHKIPVNAESLSSGTYLYSLHSSVFTSTRKFTIIK